ncbi:MAG: tetratricopeptide repeat protein [Acidobacteriota bacterium]
MSRDRAEVMPAIVLVAVAVGFLVYGFELPVAAATSSRTAIALSASRTWASRAMTAPLLSPATPSLRSPASAGRSKLDLPRAATVPVQRQGQEDPLEAGIGALRRGDLATAIPALEAAVSAAPQESRPLFYLGLARLRAGNPQQATVALRRAQQLVPSFDAAIAYQLGVALMRSGELQGVRAQFNAVLEDDPDATRARLNLGWILLQEDRGAAALQIFEAIIADHPGNALAHYYIGLVHRADGRFEKASAAYGQALRIDPGLIEARLALGDLAMASGDLARAQTLFERAASDRPALAEPRFQLGLLALRQGRLDEAIEALEQALTLDPEHKGARYNLGLAYVRAGRPVDGHTELATFAALQSTELERQRQALRSVAESRAENRYRRGTEALRRGNAEAAAEEFAGALELAGPQATVAMHLGLGAALLSSGRAAQARVALEATVEQDPQLAEAHRLLADAYTALGLTEEAARARATYERLLASRREH